MELLPIFIFHFSLEDAGKENLLSTWGYCMFFLVRFCILPQEGLAHRESNHTSLKTVSREVWKDGNFSYLGRDVKAH